MEKDTNIQYPSGIKWTKQRKDVYNILLNANEPLSVLQIYQNTLKKETTEQYAISTIYRILSAFEEHELIHKSTWMDEGTVVYEINNGGHTHYAICLACHKRIPLMTCPLHHLQLTEEEKEFEITGHKLELYGLCKLCKNKKL